MRRFFTAMSIGGLVALGYGGVTKVAHADGGVNVTTVEGHGTDTYTTYTVWYKNSRMNHWEVYTTTPNARRAADIVIMLQNLGYSSHWSANYN